MGAGGIIVPITPSNFTALNTTDFGSWLAAVNTLTGNWMGAGIMLISILGIFITLKSSQLAKTSDCFAVAAFVTWLVASVLLFIPLISLTLWAASLSFMILGGIWVWMDG